MHFLNKSILILERYIFCIHRLESYHNKKHQYSWLFRWTAAIGRLEDLRSDSWNRLQQAPQPQQCRSPPFDRIMMFKIMILQRPVPSLWRPDKILNHRPSQYHALTWSENQRQSAWCPDDLEIPWDTDLERSSWGAVLSAQSGTWQSKHLYQNGPDCWCFFCWSNQTAQYSRWEQTDQAGWNSWSLEGKNEQAAPEESMCPGFSPIPCLLCISIR